MISKTHINHLLLLGREIGITTMLLLKKKKKKINDSFSVAKRNVIYE